LRTKRVNAIGSFVICTLITTVPDNRWQS